MLENQKCQHQTLYTVQYGLTFITLFDIHISVAKLFDELLEFAVSYTIYYTSHADIDSSRSSITCKLFSLLSRGSRGADWNIVCSDSLASRRVIEADQVEWK